VSKSNEMIIGCEFYVGREGEHGECFGGWGVGGGGGGGGGR